MLYYLLFAIAMMVHPAGGVDPRSKPSVMEARSSIELFAQARDRMDLRMPDAAPFHLKVSFQAFPGNELLGPKEKPQIITGDGTYEETWSAPHQWRREITFGSYHAIEVESEKGRKMQASSDYEPSRVLMLLSALLEPVPRNLASKEFRHEGASGWIVHEVTAPGVSLVRISKDFGNAHTDITDAFFLSPQGTLVMRNERGLVTMWENPAVFEGKLCPRRLVISAGSDRELLTAEVSIEAAAKASPDLLTLPNQSAEPGMTLRPLFPFEVKMPEGDPIYFTSYTSGGTFSLHRVLDRNGRYREVELITAVDLSNALIVFNALRTQHLDKPTMDGSPCEVETMWSVM